MAARAVACQRVGRDVCDSGAHVGRFVRGRTSVGGEYRGLRVDIVGGLIDLDHAGGGASGCVGHGGRAIEMDNVGDAGDGGAIALRGAVRLAEMYIAIQLQIGPATLFSEGSGQVSRGNFLRWIRFELAIDLGSGMPLEPIELPVGV